MNKRSVIEIALALALPIAGAMGYVHGTFATVERVKEVERIARSREEKLDNIHSLLCKMAIRQQLEEAVEICTN